MQEPAELFKALGLRSRIRIINLLKTRGPLCVNEMSQTLGMTPSAISQHLKVLKFAGLVRSTRKGCWVPYEADVVGLQKCCDALSAVCTCDCSPDSGGAHGQGSLPDELTCLRKHERRLKEQLRAVRQRIKELEGR